MGHNQKSCGRCGTVYDMGTGHVGRGCPTCARHDNNLEERIEKLENAVKTLMDIADWGD